MHARSKVAFGWTTDAGPGVNSSQAVDREGASMQDYKSAGAMANSGGDAACQQDPTRRNPP
jgi:hypothetical protein